MRSQLSTSESAWSSGPNLSLKSGFFLSSPKSKGNRPGDGSHPVPTGF